MRQLNGVLAQFSNCRHSDARQRHRQFVAEGIGQASLWSGLRQQMYLGDERFAARMQQRMIELDELKVPRAPIDAHVICA